MPASPPRPSIVVLSAAGRATFTGEQAARLEVAGDVRFETCLQPLSPGELLDRLGDAEVVALTPRAVPTIAAPLVGQLPATLRGISVFATGVDHIDTRALDRRGIALRRLPDYSTISVSEHTIGLLLTLARRIHLSRDRVLGRVPAGTSTRGWEVAGRVLGIVGHGRIGSRVGRLAAGLGMQVIANDPVRPPTGVTGADLEEMLAEADVVSLHAPARPGRPPIIGRHQLAGMRAGAYLLNTSRPSLVDEGAALDAVECGALGGYALDEHLTDRRRAARLVQEGRVIETGHTAWYSTEAIERGVETWVRNAASLATGTVEWRSTALTA